MIKVNVNCDEYFPFYFIEEDLDSWADSVIKLTPKEFETIKRVMKEFDAVQEFLKKKVNQ